METFLPGLSIPALNAQFRPRGPVRQAFRRRAHRAARVVREYLPMGDWTVYLELERNLDYAPAQLAARDLRAALRGLPVRVGDNPRWGHHPVASPVELHGADTFVLAHLRRGDSLSMDGPPVPLQALSGAPGLLLEAQRLGVDLHLWEPAWQGLVGRCARSECQPEERHYSVPQMALLKGLLTR